MGDKRPWIKFWKTAYSDAGLSRLSLHDFACWVRLLLYVAINGERGALVLRGGIAELCELFTDQLSDDELPSQADSLGARSEPGRSPVGARLRPRPRGVRRVLDRLPGIHFQEAVSGVSPAVITFKKWVKYQEDSSAERMRRLRGKNRVGDGTVPSHSDGRAPSQEDIGDGARSRSRSRTPPIVPPERQQPWDRSPEDLRRFSATDPEAKRPCSATPPFRNEHPYHLHQDACRMPPVPAGELPQLRRKPS